MKPPTTTETILLARSDVARLLSLKECIAAVEGALLSHAHRRTLPPGVLGVHARDGGFHIKAAGLDGERSYFAAKINANFPGNRDHGLPTIQGVIVLCDAKNGRPLALLDSIEITILRTGAATAVAAKHLARPDAKTATICGCGNQGRIQLRALAQVLRLERALVFDSGADRAARFAEELTRELGFEVRATQKLPEAVRGSDVVVTCTPSKRAYLMRGDVAPGTFIAAVGADHPEKQELDPELMAAGKVVVDHLEQCATFGDLHHAIASGRLARSHVYAELHEIVAGQRPGRTSRDEIIIFDSTGTALQDVAAAAVVYEKARQQGCGIRVKLAE